MDASAKVMALRGYLGATQDEEHVGWTVNWAQQNDAVVIQGMYDQARRPVVEGLVNLAEAHEIPSAIKQVAGYAPYKAANWNRMRETVKRLGKQAGGRYLAYSFGIAPLIRDTESVLRYLKKVEKDYQRYVSCPIRHVSRTFIGSAPFSKASSVMTSRTIWYQGLALQVPVTRYVLTYRERCPYKTEFLRKLSYLINRFGAGGPADFAWELVPFSFVIDWFIDTSSVIGYLDDKLNSDRLEVLNLSKSMKYELETDVFRDVYDGSTNTLVESSKLGHVLYRRYLRQPLGKTYYIGLSDRFGKKQTALSVALLLQRLKG